MIKCPSCQFEQSEERLDCECCGLIFAKWKERHAPPPPLKEAPVVVASSETPEETIEPWVPRSEGPGRLYHRLADVEFQRGPAGKIIYYPWGSFGRGYQGLDPETYGRIRRFEVLFACIHCPILVLLWMSALLHWLYDPDSDYRGGFILILYLLAAYGWFWWRSREWITRLTPWTRRFDETQYLKSFAKVFHWKVCLSLEAGSLFLLAAGIWLWLAGKFPFYFRNSLAVQWTWLILSFLILTGSTYFYYFRRK